jgi:hypothetical protein
VTTSTRTLSVYGLQQEPAGTASSRSELDQLLNSLGAEAPEPTIVTLVDETSGRMLSLAVGGSDSVLNWTDENDPHPYWSSKGNDDDEGRVSFHFGNQPSEFPRTVLVDSQAARDAAQEFLATGERPAIDWQEL